MNSRREEYETTDKLRQAFGEEVVLFDDAGQTSAYAIVAEFVVDGGHYAVLQSKAMRKDGDADFYRVIHNSEGEAELETIDDEDEWERISELYDDTMFPPDERSR